MKPQYSEWARPGIVTVKREHKAWRKEKGAWFVILAMFLIGAAILFTGLQQPL